MTSPTAPSPGLGEREAVARTEEMTSEEIAKIWAEELHHQPAPPPTPVRGRYYLTECEHCGWIGSSEHLGVCEDDISCPVCCQSICGDGPDEADTAKHGEAVYQRIVTAEAAASTLRTENETLRAERNAAIARAEEAERRLDEEGEALQEEIELHAEVSAALAQAEGEIATMRAALKPFGIFGCHWVNAEGWTSTIHREAISTWFGPSDFRAASALTPEHPHGD